MFSPATASGSSARDPAHASRDIRRANRHFQGACVTPRSVSAHARYASTRTRYHAGYHCRASGYNWYHAGYNWSASGYSWSHAGYNCRAFGYSRSASGYNWSVSGYNCYAFGYPRYNARESERSSRKSRSHSGNRFRSNLPFLSHSSATG